MWFKSSDIFTPQFKFPFQCIIFDENAYRIKDFSTYGITLPENLGRAVIKRQSEYLAGRLCAQAVLKTYAMEKFQVMNGADRAPIWPENIKASISHAKGIAVAMATNDPQVKGVGIDIEYLMHNKQELELQSSILNPDEIKIFVKFAMLHAHPLSIIFSAKESLYKALYPSVKAFFSFDAASLISFDENKLTFTINQIQGNGVLKGQLIEVYYQENFDLLLTECIINME